MALHADQRSAHPEILSPRCFPTLASPWVRGPPARIFSEEWRHFMPIEDPRTQNCPLSATSIPKNPYHFSKQQRILDHRSSAELFIIPAQ